VLSAVPHFFEGLLAVKSRLITLIFSNAICLSPITFLSHFYVIKRKSKQRYEQGRIQTDPWRHSRKSMHHLLYVTVDLVCIDFQSFCFSESIGPESFSVWNLCDIIKSIVLEPYVTVDLSAERCIACRLRALASVHWCKFQNQNLLWRNEAFDISIQVMAARICKHYMQMRQIMRRNFPRNWRITNNLQSN
jgi:hypothetical protein